MRGGPARLVAFALTALVAAAAAAEPPVAGRRGLQAVHRGPEALPEAVPLADSLRVAASRSGDAIEGDVRGQVAAPVAVLQQAFARPTAWCDVLTLHFNVKSCRVTPVADDDGVVALEIETGRKEYVPPSERQAMVYRLDLRERRPDALRASLTADEGPFGVRDVRLELVGTATPDGSSAVWLHYAYRPGFVARLATRAYLATVGRGKVGFTVTGTDRNGDPEYVTGMKAAVERNALRYYLAILAYLDTRTVAPEARFEARLARWFDLSERYARQLHEMSRAEYLAIKRRERRDQETVPMVRLRSSLR